MITDNKLKHSLQVAVVCREFAKSLGLDDDKVDACFVMGFLHDIGYQDCSTTEEHPKLGKCMIDSFLKYSEDCTSAIGNHGRIFDDLSVFDLVLNYADLSVNSEGTKVNHLDRLSDIKQRYGADSRQYLNAQKMLECINNELLRFKN